MPKFTAKAAAYAGPTSSEDYNSMQTNIEYDLTTLYDRVTALESDLKAAKKAANVEALKYRALVDRISKQEKFDREQKAQAGESVTEFFDFRTTKPLLFSGDAGWSITESDRLRIDIGYGQATLPYDRVVNRFYTVDPDTRTVVPVDATSVTVSAVQEDGAIKVVQNDTRNMFNGQNESYYSREVWYPLQSDVDYVECDIDVTVPVALASVSNVLQIHTYPMGLVDITQVLYSTSNTTPTSDLTSSVTTSWQGPEVPASETNWFRAHFKPLTIQRLKVRLRSRNFVERDGFKVFMYGVQELALLAVDFDKIETGLSANAPTNGKSVVVKIDCPDGYTFNTITGLFTNLDVDADYLVMALYSDSALNTKLWDTNSSLPQFSTVAVPTNVSTLYLAIGLGYNNGSNVAPLLKDLGIRYTVR